MAKSQGSLGISLVSQGIRRGEGLYNEYNLTRQLKHRMPWWEAAKVGALGAIDPSLSSNYLQTKLDRQNQRVAELEQKKIISDIYNAANLQTESARDSIRSQTAEVLAGTRQRFAQAGTYRSGAEVNAEGKIREASSQAVANAAGANALNAEQLKLGYLSGQQDYDLKVAQLKAAANAGNAEQVGQLGQEIAPFLTELFAGKGTASGKTGLATEAGGGSLPSTSNPQAEQFPGLGGATVSGTTPAESSASTYEKLFGVPQGGLPATLSREYTAPVTDNLEQPAPFSEAEQYQYISSLPVGEIEALYSTASADELIDLASSLGTSKHTELLNKLIGRHKIKR